jgi:hypothetical protein
LLLASEKLQDVGESLPWWPQNQQRPDFSVEFFNFAIAKFNIATSVRNFLISKRDPLHSPANIENIRFTLLRLSAARC